MGAVNRWDPPLVRCGVFIHLHGREDLMLHEQAVTQGSL